MWATDMLPRRQPMLHELRGTHCACRPAWLHERTGAGRSESVGWAPASGGRRRWQGALPGACTGAAATSLPTAAGDKSRESRESALAPPLTGGAHCVPRAASWLTGSLDHFQAARRAAGSPPADFGLERHLNDRCCGRLQSWAGQQDRERRKQQQPSRLPSLQTAAAATLPAASPARATAGFFTAACPLLPTVWCSGCIQGDPTQRQSHQGPQGAVRLTTSPRLRRPHRALLLPHVPRARWPRHWPPAGSLLGMWAPPPPARRRRHSRQPLRLYFAVACSMSAVAAATPTVLTIEGLPDDVLLHIFGHLSLYER